ncbi:OmpA family protein [Falsirhodobacter halotolerans]|uniref:OmpA family protein n=1 Tax=Falsirhodobacter halotolerans TaxID=1146892 RepID=UPI001FD18D76|nr:OmpA family protein [Falsirhodobacter halotolerans]MCJ8138788.1 OmpA family protein [Falsirhodobacter halotolerans]
MKFKTPIAIGAVAFLGLAACQDPYGTGVGNSAYANQRTTAGAATGAIIGGVLGAQSGSNRDAKIAGGAIVGGILGSAIGAQMDRQAAALRASTSSNVGVRNTGNELVVTMPQDILFATNSASLRPDLQADLRAVAQNLIQYPNSNIQIVGHTDNTGSASLNQNLSERRAGAVAQTLISSGVPSNRVSSYGMGFNQPVASNATAAGRAQNRRVDIVIRPTQ